MPEILSRLDLYDVGRQYLVSRATKIDPAIVDVEGSDANLIIGASSFMGQAVSRQVADQLGSQFLDAGLSDSDLDRLVLDRYSGEVVRKGAAAPVVPLQLSRASAAKGAGTVPINTKLISKNGTEYVTLAPASFDALQLDGVSVDARAVQAGLIYQVGRNQIQRFDDSSLLWDPSLLVNNADPAAGGADRETNDDLIARARAFWPSARRGILQAIVQGAVAVPGVDSASAVEVLTTGNRPARVVQLYVADATGTCNATLAAIVQKSLLEYRAGGISVIISSSLPQIVGVQLALTFQVGVDTVTLSTNIRNAVLTFINSLGVNQPLYRSDLAAVLSRFKEVGLIATNGTVVSPAGDVVPDPGRTLRARLDDVVVL